MREIDVQTIGEQVREAVKSLNFHTPTATMQQLERIMQTEPSAPGRQAMIDIVENRRIASARGVPMCQDTGMALVFLQIGQDVHLVGGDLREAINEGVRQGYKEGYLRKSVVRDPLFDRKNTGDNTPAILHTEIVPGETVRMIVACKGFGAENMSWARILTPAAGLKGVKAEVLRCVEEAGPNACPPMVVGVGLGGTLEVAALLAKKALMRETGGRHPNPQYAALE
jgi:fumarate hydratase subunit alpha